MTIPDNAPLFLFDSDGVRPNDEAHAVMDDYINEALMLQAKALEALANHALAKAGGDVSRVTLVQERGPYGCIFRFEVQ
jgi:hypothetical protein